MLSYLSCDLADNLCQWLVDVQPWAPYTEADGFLGSGLCRTATTPEEAQRKQNAHVWDCQLEFLSCATCKAAFSPAEVGAPAPTFDRKAPTLEILEAIRWKARQKNAAKE